jgi:hypothetical protein
MLMYKPSLGDTAEAPLITREERTLILRSATKYD